MKKESHIFIGVLLVVLIALYFMTKPSVQGFQDTPTFPSSMSSPPAVPTTPSNDAGMVAPSTMPSAQPSAALPMPTTTPAAMNTATTTIKLSDLQRAKDAVNMLKVALDTLH